MPYEYSEKRNQTVKERRERRRKVIIDLLGGVCAICGFDDPRALQFDHIHGDGKKDVTNNRHGYLTSVLNSVMANEGKFQLLCANCNWISRCPDNQDSRPCRWRNQ